MDSVLNHITIRELLKNKFRYATAFSDKLIITDHLGYLELFKYPCRIDAVSIFICTSGRMDCCINLKNYTVLPNYRAGYEPILNEGVQLVECPYFTTAVYDLTEPMTLDYSELDSFVILIAVKGEGTIKANGEEMTFKMGDTILLPATTNEVKIEGEVKFLETYV